MEKIAASDKKLTLHQKVDKLAKSMAAKNKKDIPRIHRPVKLGLVDAGMAGASALVNKVRQNNQEG
jgi:hypothetical protein